MLAHHKLTVNRLLICLISSLLVASANGIEPQAVAATESSGFFATLTAVRSNSITYTRDDAAALTHAAG